MTIERAQDIPDGTTLTADVCIVGSGAAGLALAERLPASDRVVVLEAGGLDPDPDAENGPFAIDCVGLPQNNTVASRGRQFGGSTDLWFGRIAALDPIDFEERPWVPHSGWPLEYSELQPWLLTAASMLDVPHFDKIDIDAWEPNATTDMVMRSGEARLGVFLWADGMAMGALRREWMERSTNVRLVAEATANELVPNESSTAIESLAVVGPDLNRFSVRATTYVLAAGGLENPRLLLASTERNSAGIGNDSDTVGRYFMDHPRGEGLAGIDLRGLEPEKLDQLALLGEKAASPYGQTQLRVTFPESMQRDEGLLNHSLHAHIVSDVQQTPGYAALRRLFNRGESEADMGASLSADVVASIKVLPRLSAFAARRALGRERPSEFVVVDQMEQAPDPSSRLTVDHRRTDRFGLPRVQLDWRVAESTFASQKRMHQLFAAILERAGIPAFWSDVLEPPSAPPDPLLDMKHPSGTTRMSASQRNGVVDSDCRVHGVANLYVTGSSVFPTVGHANPTLTIVALAARLAHHLGGRTATEATDTSPV